MDLRRISPAITRQQKLTVVSVEEVRRQARVDFDEEDDLIRSYIVTAYDHIQRYLRGYILLEEQYEFYTSPCDDGIDLPVRPLSTRASPVTVESRDTAGTYTALTAGTYFIREAVPLAIVREPSSLWPNAFNYVHPRAYRVRIWAGHPTADTIPEPLKQAIRMLAAHFYKNRETTGPDGRDPGAAIPFGLQALCGPYRFALNHS